MISFEDIQAGKLYLLDTFNDLEHKYKYNSNEVIFVFKTYSEDDGCRLIEYLYCGKKYTEYYDICELFDII